MPFCERSRNPLGCGCIASSPARFAKAWLISPIDWPASGAKAATYTRLTTLGSFPASVITTPPYECPTRTVGPSCAATARLVAATSSANDVRGLPAVVTRSPLAFSNGTIFDQLESSANAPCTSTTFFAAPAEPACAIVAPPNEDDPTAYTDRRHRRECSHRPSCGEF